MGQMVRISVTTPSVRKELLPLVKKCLDRQTFPRDQWEWIVCSPFECPDADVWLFDDGPRPGEFYSLTRSFNRLFQAARGELVVNLVDGMWFEPDLLERFWLHYINNPRAIVGGVGHQYARLENGKPEGLVWSDPRARLDQGSFYPAVPTDIEWTAVSIPTKALEAIGGLDGTYDQVAALGEKEAMLRASRAGFEAYLDQSIQYRALRHDRVRGQVEWDEAYARGCDLYLKHVNEIQSGIRPIRLTVDKPIGGGE